MLEPTALGAVLYVPASHKDLRRIATGEKLAAIRSLIFCTEDAVSAEELPAALQNLAGALEHLECGNSRRCFVRVRNPEVLRGVLEMRGVESVAGFVLPKVTASTLDDYLDCMDRTAHRAMPTIETREAFDDAGMRELLRLLDCPSRRERILSLRIGGNDLLSQLRMRRPRKRTIYETPIGHVISRLVTTFVPYGFSMSAPVFEYLDDWQTLAREVEQDLDHGLVGKTAIHPAQVPEIERHYRICPQDVEAAIEILDPNGPAVFRFQQSMCERATHRRWAQSVLGAAGAHHDRAVGLAREDDSPEQVRSKRS